jgi:hypothetical protein
VTPRRDVSRNVQAVRAVTAQVVTRPLRCAQGRSPDAEIGTLAGGWPLFRRVLAWSAQETLAL